MKNTFSLLTRPRVLFRLILTALAVAVFGPAGFGAYLINPFLTGSLGAYPSINAQTKSGITALSPDASEILWEHEVLQAAAQTSPFADNMTGGMGSGKPFIVKNDTTKVVGTAIVISTVDQLGSRGVQGAGVRVGQEEKVKPGDFKLFVDMWWCGTGIENTAQAQTIIGSEWDGLAQQLITKRLEKKQSDDKMMTLLGAATGTNTVYPNGKTLDTLSSADTYQTSLIVKFNGTLKDLGAMPINARKVKDQSLDVPPISRYLSFLTDAGARPIKTESSYLEGVRLAKERGENNDLFTGEYSVWDDIVTYPWKNVIHGGYGSVGSALQPEAKLGTAIVAKGTSSNLPGGLSTSTAGGLDGGGSNTAAALTTVDWFEFFANFAYVPINGQTVTLRPGTRYFAVIDSATGKIAFFSFTGNTGSQLTGLTRLGSTTTGDYNTTVGSVTWNAGAWLTAADGVGFQGVTEGVLTVGSPIIECNAKGTPLCFGFGLGEMAAVTGYGRLASGKTMANKTYYEAPHGQAKASGLEVAHGTAAFQRPDGNTPNYVTYGMARDYAGFPNIS